MPKAVAEKPITKQPRGNWVLVETRDPIGNKCFAFSLKGQLMMDADRVMKVRDREIADLILDTLKNN